MTDLDPDDVYRLGRNGAGKYHRSGPSYRTYFEGRVATQCGLMMLPESTAKVSIIPPARLCKRCFPDSTSRPF